MEKNKYPIRYLQLILATAIILVSSTAQLIFQQYFYHENALYIFFYPFLLIVVLLTNSFTIGCFITLTSAVLGLLIHKNDFYYTSNTYYVNGFIFLVYTISGLFFSYSQAHNYKIRSELIFEKKKIDSLVDSIPELIGLWSKDFINIFANKHYHTFYGFAENSIPGLHLSKVIGEELLIKNLETYRSVLTGIEQTVERTIHDIYGNTKVVRINYVPYKVQGSIEGFFVFSNDITEYKKTITENEVLYKKIIQNEKLVSLGSMAAGISHEINNPIAVIRNYSELALKTIDKENIKNESLVKKLNKIIELTERVSYITSGLLTYARR
ncbi:MAG: histidine kinase dimerization/phospho-acceptor domain-containing protein, partial [Pseudobdellovibrio sp.]